MKVDCPTKEGKTKEGTALIPFGRFWESALPPPEGGALRSRSVILMIAGGNHTSIHGRCPVGAEGAKNDQVTVSERRSTLHSGSEQCRYGFL